MSAPILAAGGVVWRPAGHTVEIAVAHRPRYDDWSLPKGKLNRRETEMAAAVREIGEEIGARVQVQRFLTNVEYRTSSRQDKVVSYWSMRDLGGCFAPGPEVDELAWVPVSAARRVLSYEIDQQVLDTFAALPVPDSTVLLVRHARAGKRSSWAGDDAVRPLDAVGRAQSRRLAAMLPLFVPTAIVSADLTRCEQTVAPLAAATALQVRSDHAFSDDAYAHDPDAVAEAVTALARPGEVTALSSQGLTIPGLIATMFPELRHTRTRKSATWAVSFAGGTPVSADYYEDAVRPRRD